MRKVSGLASIDGTATRAFLTCCLAINHNSIGWAWQCPNREEAVCNNSVIANIPRLQQLKKSFQFSVFRVPGS